MNLQMMEKSPGKETRDALVCRIRHRVGRRGPSPTAGEVEIENISAKTIEIEVTMHPLQYLDLIVRNEVGNIVPTVPYGNIFSPRGSPVVFRLVPGEKYTHNISLVGTLPQEQQLPGTYTVCATYSYNELKAISEPLSVQIPAQSS